MKKHFVYLKILVKTHHHSMKELQQTITKNGNGKMYFSNILISNHFEPNKVVIHMYDCDEKKTNERTPTIHAVKTNHYCRYDFRIAFLLCHSQRSLFTLSRTHVKCKNYEISQMSIQKPNLSARESDSRAEGSR